MLDHFNSLSIRTRFIFSFLFIVFLSSVVVAIVLYYAVESSNYLTKSQIIETRNQLLIVGGIVILISLGLAFLASNYFSEQLKRISHLLKSYSEGHLENRETITTSDEIGHILENLHSMAEKLQQHQNDIIHAEKRISDLYNNAPTMFCTLDLNGILLNVNRTLTFTLSRTGESIMGKPFLDLVTDDTVNLLGTNFKEFLLKHDSQKGVEFKLKRENQDSVYVAMSWNFFTENKDNWFSSYAYHDGIKVYGIRAIIKDITIEKESERRKSILFETMSTVPRLLGTFVSFEETLEYVLEKLKKVVDYDFSYILLFPNKSQSDYKIAATYGLGNKGTGFIGKTYSKDDLNNLNLIENKKSRLVDQFFLKEAFTGPENQNTGQSSMIIPLQFQTKIIGFMAIDKAKNKYYGQEELILAEAFASIIDSAIQNLLLRDELESTNLLIQRELNMAASIQQGILPKGVYNWNGIKISGHYEAMEQIGGDFYDFFHLPQGELAVFIADVSGHGIPAALVTTMAKISFQSIAQRYQSPKKILKEINLELCENLKTDDYLSVFFLVIEKNYQITYTNAGHQNALLYRKREKNIERLDTLGYFVGMMKEMGDSYEESTIQLNYGDRILLYTDGIVEAVNSKKEQFSIERLERIFEENQNSSIEDLKKVIIKKVKEFHEGVNQKDDLSLLIIELDEKYEIVIQLFTEGKSYFKDGNHSESLLYFTKALEIDPNNLDILLFIGEAYFRNYQFEESVKYFEQYVEIKKNNPYIYFHLALSYFKLTDYERSIRANLKALDIKKNFVKALHLLGLIHKKLNLYEEAKEYFIELLKIDPHDTKAKKEIKYIDSFIKESEIDLNKSLK